MSILHSICGGITSVPPQENPSLYPLTTPNRACEQVDLAQYRGKVVLIVNTASKCGFTKQFDALEVLYQRYSGAGLVIVGFPSNDFMQQEPGTDSEIESFCRLNHGVTFPLFPKAAVTGQGIQPLFAALTTKGPADLRGKVRWNFEKFLLDREGRLVGRWRSWVNPRWRIFERAVERFL